MKTFHIIRNRHFRSEFPCDVRMGNGYIEVESKTHLSIISTHDGLETICHESVIEALEDAGLKRIGDFTTFNL